MAETIFYISGSIFFILISACVCVLAVYIARAFSQISKTNAYLQKIILSVQELLETLKGRTSGIAGILAVAMLIIEKIREKYSKK